MFLALRGVAARSGCCGKRAAGAAGRAKALRGVAPNNVCFVVTKETKCFAWRGRRTGQFC